MRGSPYHELTDSESSYLLQVWCFMVVHLFSACRKEVLLISNTGKDHLNGNSDPTLASSLAFYFRSGNFTFLWIAKLSMPRQF